ncbi:hypothetical protein C8F01DRAFT_936585, partial [Mycena amicta]
AFNRPTVKHYFELVEGVLCNNGKRIPPQNVYNFDEIGIQIGGGRKNTNEKFFFAAGDKSKYRTKSDNLELVSILESVRADGQSPIPPCFCFSGVLQHDEWYADHPD